MHSGRVEQKCLDSIFGFPQVIQSYRQQVKLRTTINRVLRLNQVRIKFRRYNRSIIRIGNDYSTKDEEKKDKSLFSLLAVAVLANVYTELKKQVLAGRRRVFHLHQSRALVLCRQIADRCLN